MHGTGRASASGSEMSNSPLKFRGPNNEIAMRASSILFYTAMALGWYRDLGEGWGAWGGMIYIITQR